jgi:serine/threonine protein kinase/tetratricopeptide (TPR) repeat protein
MHEQSIFIEALEKEDPAERAAFLDRVCASDPALRQRIDRLLHRHQQADSFLDAPAVVLDNTADEPLSERPGTVIGSYKLLEQIGEGGFGVVFMAEQQQPVRRKVALKVLKPGMETRQVVARFEAERQALALMDHPNIACIFDGGETASGRPYFVMELVKGIPITDYCDQSRLTPRERLELFVPVCQAVQHAHQKGIIHRDLKPSNMLVTLHDGTPVVKVIDFGVAKALGHQLTDKTLFTGFAQLVGTPLYMSPEQAALSGLDVDTRSDIYSLGVLLYELLTGTTPFDKERLREVGYDELRRIIREEEPLKPSTRLSTLGQAATTVSAQRQSDPKRLSQFLHGELDWIVMKCLEKDRSRRYETANGLTLDVQRYLHDEPVQACPPSAGYRLRKFARRNKGVLLTLGLVTAALMIGTAVSAWQAQRATRAQALAQERLHAAEANLLLARQAVDEMCIQVASLRGASDLEATERFCRKVLTLAGKLAEENPGEPASRETVANSHTALGVVLQKRRRGREAADQFRQALAIHERLAAEFPGDSSHRYHQVRLLNFLGIVLRTLPGEAAAALQCHQQALGLCDQLVAEFPDQTRYRSQLVRSHFALGIVLRLTGRHAEAVQAFQQALDAYRPYHDTSDDPENHLQFASVHNEWAWLLATCPEVTFRDPIRAVALARKAVELEPGKGGFWNTLGVACFRAGDWNVAIAALERADELAPGRELAWNALFLAMAHRQRGEDEQARKEYDRAVQWMQKNQPGNEELRRFRAEAAELLGMTEK